MKVTAHKWNHHIVKRHGNISEIPDFIYGNTHINEVGTK